MAFVKWQTEKNGLKVERFVPGRNDQVVLCREPQKYPQFEFRNVAANGEIWTGQGTATEHRMPPLETIPRNKWPDENVFSISFRLSYGKFKFFNGGDLPGIRKNSPAWYDMEWLQPPVRVRLHSLGWRSDVACSGTACVVRFGFDRRGMRPSRR